VLWTARSVRLTLKATALAAIAFCTAVSVWLPFLVAATGGLAAFYHLLRTYAVDQTRGTSYLMGAPSAAAIHMAAEAIVWSCLGVLSWIWVLPSAIARDRAVLRNPVLHRHLLLWFVPGLFLSGVFHVGDPDQTLAIVPVTCLFGGCVLSAFKNASSRARAAILSAALLLNVFLFLKPVTKIAKASTYSAVAWNNRFINGLIEGGRRAQTTGATIVFPAGIAGWRNLSYYLPDVPLLVVGVLGDALGVVEAVLPGFVEVELLGVVVLEVEVSVLVLLDGVHGTTVLVVPVWFCMVPPVTDPALPATPGVPCVTAGLPVELEPG